MLLEDLELAQQRGLRLGIACALALQARVELLGDALEVVVEEPGAEPERVSGLARLEI